MTPEKLAAAILEAETDTTMRARAAAIGEQIRAEDGTRPGRGLYRAAAIRAR